MRSPALLALALLVASATRPAAADEPATEAPPEPEHPGVDLEGRRIMEFRGGIEAGVRSVSGKEGRYEQDVNLDGGFRLLSAEIEGTSLEDGLALDLLSLRFHGLGDPMQTMDFRAYARRTYDLRIFSDREETVYRAARDPHPFDTERGRDGGRLSFRPVKDLEIRMSTERVVRRGEGLLDQYFVFAGRPVPLAASLEFEQRAHSAGFDAASGAFRFGGTASWSRTQDESLRSLEGGNAADPTRGTHRDDSSASARSGAGRAGLKLAGGSVDLSFQGGYRASETDSEVFEDALVLNDAGTAVSSWQYLGAAAANARGWWWRGEALLLPSDDWEVQGRYEQRSAAVRGSADSLGLLDAAPLPEEFGTRIDARLRRSSVEARWRASAAWRLRGGVEQVAESIRAGDPDPDAWRPTTWAGTAGVDFRPSDRFDASLLARAVAARDAATPLSADEGRMLSLRLRARRPDGWHATGFARVKQRSMEETDSVVGFDSFGLSLGCEGEGGFFELSATREEFTLESDTDVVLVAAAFPLPAVRGPYRARYDESVDAATLDFSVVVSGPLRAFGSARGAAGDGDLPYRQVDASAGLGWRFARSTELRAEARRVSYEEEDRGVDDYSARIFTLSLLWEF